MNIKVVKSADCRLRRSPAWDGIVIHHTGFGTAEPATASAWSRFADSMTAWMTANDENYLSAHFQINRDGSIVQLVDPETHEAFHAGKSEAWNPRLRAVCSDWNRYSIGIELIGDGNRIDYTPEQYAALAELCRDLMRRFPSIHPQAIVGHEQVAPGRKSDPGSRFEWLRFFRLLFKS